MKVLAFLFLVMCSFSTSLDDVPDQQTSETDDFSEESGSLEDGAILDNSNGGEEGEESEGDESQDDADDDATNEAEAAQEEETSDAAAAATETEGEIERSASLFNPINYSPGFYHYHLPSHSHEKIEPWRMGYNPGLENRLVAKFEVQKVVPHVSYRPQMTYPKNYCFQTQNIDLQWSNAVVPSHVYYNDNYNHWHCCLKANDGSFYAPGFFLTAPLNNNCQGEGTGHLRPRNWGAYGAHGAWNTRDGYKMRPASEYTIPTGDGTRH